MPEMCAAAVVGVENEAGIRPSSMGVIKQCLFLLAVFIDEAAHR
jgi:hypothetical protein